MKITGACQFLRNGEILIIDLDDIEKANQFRWSLQRPLRNWSSGYAQGYLRGSGRKNYTLVKLHRFLLDCPSNQTVDHINGNGLDNRRANLRICSLSDNLCNRREITGNSKYRGVHLNRDGKWVAYIKKDGQRKHLGLFDNELEAARIRDEAAKILHGSFAILNLEDTIC